MKKKTLEAVVGIPVICVALIFGFGYANDASFDQLFETDSTHNIDNKSNDEHISKDGQYDRKAKDYYLVNGKADLKASDYPEPGQYKYMDTDKLDRTRTSKATINHKSFEDSKGERQDFKAGSEPSGWGHNERVHIKSDDGSETYNGYMYNRSHLIGDSLGGDAVKENAVTGTRPQNVGQPGTSTGGMRHTETSVEKYMNQHKDGIVYYEAKPNYVKDEKIPRTVTVNMMSKDKKLNEKVTVYNNAKGYRINFKDGTFKSDKSS